MEECPYCGEKVQDDSPKCEECEEWMPSDSLTKLSNEEWMVFMVLFSEQKTIKGMKKLLKDINNIGFLSDAKVVTAEDVAFEFREEFWCEIGVLMSRLVGDGEACDRYGVSAFTTEEASKFFNCLSLRDWKKIGIAIQDDFIVNALIRLFSHIKEAQDFRHLPKGVENIINTSQA